MYENKCSSTSFKHASMHKSNVASYNEKKYWSDILNRNYLSTANNEIKVPLLKISNLTWQYPRKIQRLLVDVFSRGRLDSKQWTAQKHTLF